MSIYLYSGTPGSGKSYHAVRDILQYLRSKKDHTIVSNFQLNFGKKSYKNHFVYLDNSELDVEHVLRVIKAYPVEGGEGRYLLVIDEAQLIYNARSWEAEKRSEWISFFTQHRKYGFDIILIAQFDRMLDRQIRCLIETEIRHRKLNNYKAGWLLSALTLGKSTFLALSYWYGGSKLLLKREIIVYSSRIGKLYNTCSVFEGMDGFS